jgi:hypothetical protein
MAEPYAYIAYYRIHLQLLRRCPIDIPPLIKAGLSPAYLRDISGISLEYLTFSYEKKRGFRRNDPVKA